MTSTFNCPEIRSPKDLVSGSVSCNGRNMKRNVRIGVLLLLLCAALPSNNITAQISIIQTGSWSETVSASDLQAGAGTDLISSYESTTDAGSIDISGTTGLADNWRVDVRKVDTTWHLNLHLFVKRTADGTGPGSITGGTAYQEVTSSDLSFFSGAGDRSAVKTQLKITGVSIEVPPNSYSVTVYYTVVDN